MQMFCFATIPWQGSEDQLTVLFAMGAVVAYSVYIIVAKKDTEMTPRRSPWR